jgi:methionyl aminopeptidase
MVAKSDADRAGLRRANREVAKLLAQLTRRARPGTTTESLDRFAREVIAALGAEPVFHTEAGFPAAINTSVNDAVMHGVPGPYVLQSGDILSIDVGMLLDGYCGDAATTITVGEGNAQARRLMDVAKGTMRAGIAAAVVGNRVGDIGFAMQSYAEERGYHVLRDFCGHGVGHRMHEWPSVPFVGSPGTGPELVEGMVLTIEPAVVEGSPAWKLDADGWTVRTRDGGLSAQCEHTIMVDRGRPSILSVA